MNRANNTSKRPDYIGPDWMYCTQGMAFAKGPPPSAMQDAALTSPNPWERLACVTLRAQSGDFQHVQSLLDIAKTGADFHLRNCAIDVFALSAPATVVDKLAILFDHPDYDTRIEVYSAARYTCDLRLTEALARHRSRVQLGERERVMDNISDMLEPLVEDLEFVDSGLEDQAFERRVAEVVEDLRSRYGPETAILHGEPVDCRKIASKITELCAGDAPEEDGGVIDGLFGLLGGMAGVSYAGCLDDECSPIMPKIAQTLNKLQQSKALVGLEPGRRYFFRHPIP